MIATKSHPCSICLWELKPGEIAAEGELIGGRRWFYSDGTTAV